MFGRIKTNRKIVAMTKKKRPQKFWIVRSLLALLIIGGLWLTNLIRVYSSWLRPSVVWMNSKCPVKPPFYEIDTDFEKSKSKFQFQIKQ